METPLQPTEAPKQGAAGAIIGIVLIILIIAAGGVYFWMMKQDALKNAEIGSDVKENANELNSNQNDASNDIQAATDVNIDAELNELDKEFSE